MAENETKKINRISNLTGFFMIFFAIILDIIGGLLTLFAVGIIINRITTPINYGLYWFWFKLKGVSFSGDSKKIAKIGGTFLLEMIPVLGALPGFTLGVFLTLAQVRAEDKIENIKNKPKISAYNKNTNIIRRRRS